MLVVRKCVGCLPVLKPAGQDSSESLGLTLSILAIRLSDAVVGNASYFWPGHWVVMCYFLIVPFISNVMMMRVLLFDCID